MSFDSVATSISQGDELSNADRAILRAYSVFDHDRINALLRRPRRWRAPKADPSIPRLDAMIDRSRLTAPLTLYRGIPGLSGLYGPLDSITELCDPGFSSFSRSLAVAEQFARNHLGYSNIQGHGGILEVVFPKGFPVLSLEQDGRPGEYEYLPPRGTRLIRHGYTPGSPSLLYMRPAGS